MLIRNILICLITQKGLMSAHKNIHKKLFKLYRKGEKVPELVTRLSKEHDDRHPTPEWNENWENTLIPVERVVAYWSRVLAPAETRYSATE